MGEQIVTIHLKNVRRFFIIASIGDRPLPLQIKCYPVAARLSNNRNSKTA